MNGFQLTEVVLRQDIHACMSTAPKMYCGINERKIVWLSICVVVDGLG